MFKCDNCYETFKIPKMKFIVYGENEIEEPFCPHCECPHFDEVIEDV